MAFTFGFHNSMNGDRKYNAEQMSAIFDGLIRDGIFQSIGNIFGTTPGSGMQVIVGSGKAWFNHTWSTNDTPMLLDIIPADVTMPRYSASILEIDSSINVRANRIRILNGTPATNPIKPTMTHTETLNQYPLAYILVPAMSTSILQANIEVVVGTSECPFVTGILQLATIDDIWGQWQASFKTWLLHLQDELNVNQAANLQRQIEEIKQQIFTTHTGIIPPGPSLGIDNDIYIKTR